MTHKTGHFRVQYTLTPPSRPSTSSPCDDCKLFPRLLKNHHWNQLVSVIRIAWKWPLTVIVQSLRKIQHLHEISVFMVILLSCGTFQEVIRESGLSIGYPPTPTPPPCHCYSLLFRVMSDPPITATTTSDLVTERILAAEQIYRRIYYTLLRLGWTLYHMWRICRERCHPSVKMSNSAFKIVFSGD